MSKIEEKKNKETKDPKNEEIADSIEKRQYL